MALFINDFVIILLDNDFCLGFKLLSVLNQWILLLSLLSFLGGNLFICIFNFLLNDVFPKESELIFGGCFLKGFILNFLHNISLIYKVLLSDLVLILIWTTKWFFPLFSHFLSSLLLLFSQVIFQSLKQFRTTNYRITNCFLDDLLFRNWSLRSFMMLCSWWVRLYQVSVLLNLSLCLTKTCSSILSWSQHLTFRWMVEAIIVLLITSSSFIFLSQSIFWRRVKFRCAFTMVVFHIIVHKSVWSSKVW